MIFIDTGAFLARYIESDQHHAAAREQWRRAGPTSLAWDHWLFKLC